MTFIGIGLATKHQAPAAPAVPDLYPDPPWVDDLTNAASLGWQQFGSETNVGTYGVSGFALTVQASNSAVIAPVGALMEDGTTSADVDAVVIGTMTPGSGATGGLQAIRSDPSINGYVAQLKQDATTYTIELLRLAGGAGTVLATVALDPTIAWGGVWLKTEVVGSDTRLRAFVLHSDGGWRSLIDHTDADVSDDDHAGQPWIGMWSVGGSTDFALTGYVGTLDGAHPFTSSVLMESSFTGESGTIHGQPADTAGTTTFDTVLGTVNRNGSGRLVGGASGENIVLYDVDDVALRVDAGVQISGVNAQDRFGLYLASEGANNNWITFYNRANATNKFTIVERVAGVGTVRAGSGVAGAHGAGSAAMSIAISGDGLTITADLGTYSTLSYTPGGAITRYGTKAGANLSPSAAPTGAAGVNSMKVTK